MQGLRYNPGVNRRTERRTWWTEQLGCNVELTTCGQWEVRGTGGPALRTTVDALRAPDEFFDAYERNIRDAIQYWEGIEPRDAAAFCFAYSAIQLVQRADLSASITWHTVLATAFAGWEPCVPTRGAEVRGAIAEISNSWRAEEGVPLLPGPAGQLGYVPVVTPRSMAGRSLASLIVPALNVPRRCPEIVEGVPCGRLIDGPRAKRCRRCHWRLNKQKSRRLNR
jgi:hypothetical protein